MKSNCIFCVKTSICHFTKFLEKYFQIKMQWQFSKSNKFRCQIRFMLHKLTLKVFGQRPSTLHLEAGARQKTFWSFHTIFTQNTKIFCTKNRKFSAKSTFAFFLSAKFLIIHRFLMSCRVGSPLSKWPKSSRTLW